MEEGFTKIPNKLIKSEKLSSKEKLVFIVMLMYSFGKKNAWPSRNTLSKESGLNIRTVDKAIKSLEAKRFLKIDKTKRNNYYELNFKSPSS